MHTWRCVSFTLQQQFPRYHSLRPRMFVHRKRVGAHICVRVCISFSSTLPSAFPRSTEVSRREQRKQSQVEYFGALYFKRYDHFGCYWISQISVKIRNNRKILLNFLIRSALNRNYVSDFYYNISRWITFIFSDIFSSANVILRSISYTAGEYFSLETILTVLHCVIHMSFTS